MQCFTAGNNTSGTLRRIPRHETRRESLPAVHASPWTRIGETRAYLRCRALCAAIWTCGRVSSVQGYRVAGSRAVVDGRLQVDLAPTRVGRPACSQRQGHYERGQEHHGEQRNG